jgi:hypothetical protein
MVPIGKKNKSNMDKIIIIMRAILEPLRNAAPTIIEIMPKIKNINPGIICNKVNSQEKGFGYIATNIAKNIPIRDINEP